MSRVYDGFEKLENSNSFQEIIEFIQSSECIVTNSYHGMYWSLLLNKKVGIIPNSSKFFDFIHTPEVLVDSNSDLNRLTNLKRPIFDILGACIEANVNFSIKVMEMELHNDQSFFSTVTNKLSLLLHLCNEDWAE